MRPRARLHLIWQSQPCLPRYVPDAATPIANMVAGLLAPGGAAVITDPGRVVAEEFVTVCQAHTLLDVVRYEIPFVSTSVTTIPKLLILVVTRSEDAHMVGGNVVAAAVLECVVHYMRHRANTDAAASDVKTCVFTS